MQFSSLALLATTAFSITTLAAPASVIERQTGPRISGSGIVNVYRNDTEALIGCLDANAQFTATSSACAQFDATVGVLSIGDGPGLGNTDSGLELAGGADALSFSVSRDRGKGQERLCKIYPLGTWY